jgi:hypothetical protein
MLIALSMMTLTILTTQRIQRQNVEMMRRLQEEQARVQRDEEARIQAALKAAAAKRADDATKAPTPLPVPER